MAMLGPGTLAGRVRVIIELSVRDMVVDVIERVMRPLIEGGLVAQRLADDVIVGFRQRAMAFADLAACRGHDLQLGQGELGEVDRGWRPDRPR